MRHLDFLQRFPIKNNWMKELCSEVAGGSEDSQIESEQPSGSLGQEIDKGVLFGCESTNVRTGRLVNSCVPVSVERLDQDKDADENVDADQMGTGRLVRSGQSPVLFTQPEDIHIDFSVSGLPHAVVKQAENFPCSRTRDEDRESSSSRSTSSRFAATFSDESKAMIREMGNVELFELCETIPKVQCSECLLYWNQGVICCTCGHLLVESESSQNFHQWRLDAGPRRSASRWTNWHRKTTPTAHPLWSMREKKTGISH